MLFVATGFVFVHGCYKGLGGDPYGSFGTDSVGTATEGACDPYTGGDPVACLGPAPSGCVDDDDCCAHLDRQAIAGSDAPGKCPDEFPNNWRCVDPTAGPAECVHDGCGVDGDCVMDGFTCETDNATGTKHCVHTCPSNDATGHAYCHDTAFMPGTACAGTISGGGWYCVEDV